MKAEDVIERLENGEKPIIQFLPEVETETEEDFDEGMKARVVDFRYVGNDVYELMCDITEFEEHNEPLMKANYYDKNGVPCLTWKQTTFYPKNKKTRIYITHGWDVYFQII